MSEDENECQVYVNTSLKGLSYTYFKVVRKYIRPDNYEVLNSNVVYSNIDETQHDI